MLNLQKVDDAKAILEDVVKQDPKDPHAWYNLGLYYKNTNETDAAVAAFRHVIEIDPNDADTWYFLGTAYAQAKQYPQAIDAFEHALKLNPLHASAEFGISRAHQQSGDPEHAREHLKKFQYIKDNKLGSPMSLSYGEQGQYSRAEESAGVVEKVPAAIPVKFVDVTVEAGLVGKRSPPESKDLVSFLGAGACFLDFDGDGKVDLFLSDGGPNGGMALYHNLGNGKFEDVTRKAGLNPALHGIGCTAGDYDNDGATDLAATVASRMFLFHNEKNSTFKDVTEAAGIKGVGPALGILFVDYDHDGDLDIYVTSTLKDAPAPSAEQNIQLPSGLAFPGNHMWRNNGDGTFSDTSSDLDAFLDPSVSAIGTDYNNDRAVDLVVTDVKGPIVLENPREGKFLPRTPWQMPLKGLTVGVAALDFNHDGWMDMAFHKMALPASPCGKTIMVKSLSKSRYL